MKGSYKLPINCLGVHKVRLDSITNTHDMTCQVKNRPLALRGHATKHTTYNVQCILVSNTGHLFL